MRVAVVGSAGRMGLRHLVLLSAHHDVTEVDIVHGQSSLARVVGSVDAAVVASPTSTHHDIASWFLENKVPVLVEKPVAYSQWQARDLVSTADHYGTTLSVGYQERFNPAWRKMRHLFYGAGELIITRTGVLPQGDYGKVGIDLASHDIDLLRHAYGDRIVFRSKVKLKDHALYEFYVHEYGVHGHVEAKYLRHNELPERRWAWAGRERAQADLLLGTLNVNGTEQDILQVNTLAEEHAAWFDRIRGNKSDICTAEQALQVIKDVNV